MKTVSIPAAINGQPGVYNENAGDDTVFSCISSSGPFQVQIKQKKQSGFATLVLGEPGGPGLGMVTLLNSGSAAVDVTFDTGSTAYKGATASSPVDNTITLPQFGNAGSVGGTRAIPTGSGATISGTQTINGVSKTRQYIEISSLSSADNIYVFTSHQTGAAFDQCVGIVYPNSFRRFDISSDLVLVNIAATAIQCTAYERY
jgi:hypothetical protein